MRAAILFQVRYGCSCSMRKESRVLMGCSRMKTADEQYKQGFYDELNAFRDRVKKRAQQKVEEALKQYEEVEVL